MYHFKTTEHSPETTLLNEHTELSGRAIKFLKDFQIGAVRFLFEQFCKQDFCILNDESGLGKTASVAVFLGIVAERKNCLVVVSNNEECVTGWRFHLDILTDLKVGVLNVEKDYDANDYSVYIGKWNTLREIGDLSKFNFDLIVVDNRELILSNTFCISTLLKNFENKVKVVISSVDVTSDVKLLHNILRLGGRLEHQLESFKAFEQKFKLPDLKAISSKKSDLEDYFVRREILNDYCRDFRLRRYRHQFENVLPLVDPERYKTFLKEWQASTNERTTNTAFLVGEQLPNEINTEELLEQFQKNPESIRFESASAPPTTTENTNHAEEAHNTMPPPTALDITDDIMEMPPLVFVTDSDEGDEEEDVIFLSSESAEAVAAALPVIDIEEDEDRTPEKPVNINVKTEKLSPKKQPVAIQKDAKQPTVQTRQKNKRKSATPAKKPETMSPVVNNSTTPKTRSSSKSGERARRSVGKNNNKNAEEKTKNATPIRRIRKELPAVKEVKKTPTQKQQLTNETLKIKAEKLTPKKNEAATNETRAAGKNKDLKIESPQLKKDIVRKLNISTSELESVESVERPKLSKTATPKTPTDTRRSQKRVSTPIIGVPLRDTRSMQRNTRSSGGKRKCFALDFEDDHKKPRAPTKTKQIASAEKVKSTNKAKNSPSVATAKPSAAKKTENSAKEKQLTKTKNKSSTQNDAKTAQEPSTKADAKKNKTKAEESKESTQHKKDTARKPNKSISELESEVHVEQPKKDKTKVISSTQSSVLPMSSDYEEIQCGQKLSYSSSNDNTPPLLEKLNEFRKPSTPPRFRASLYDTPRLTSIDSDSDVLLLPPPSSNSQKRKSKTDTVIVLSSSQDEASLSSQASSAEQDRPPAKSSKTTAVAGTQKRKRFSKRMSLPTAAVKELHSFGDLLTKQRETVKSPDLFSVGSDAGVLTQGSSNVLPFTQPHGKAAPTAPATTTSPAFGFKIFGSEVRSFQQSKAAESKDASDQSSTRRPTRGSCLNILEQMFENNAATPSMEKGGSVAGKTKEKEARKSRQSSRASGKLTNDEISSQLSQPTPRKPIHGNRQKLPGESDDIFEITNNATFGSTLRISASGHISPVTPANNSNNQHHSSSHNKITNYLIGNGVGAGGSSNEQLLKTPNKRTQQQQQSLTVGSAGSGVGVGNPVIIATTQTRKSPKSAKSTQTTKLTKWFRRSSVDESCLNKTATISADSTARNDTSKSAKLVKRRRLDLSFKS